MFAFFQLNAAAYKNHHLPTAKRYFQRLRKHELRKYGQCRGQGEFGDFLVNIGDVTIWSLLSEPMEKLFCVYEKHRGRYDHQDPAYSLLNEEFMVVWKHGEQWVMWKQLRFFCEYHYLYYHELIRLPAEAMQSWLAEHAPHSRNTNACRWISASENGDEDTSHK